jgi:hypothetical protein
MKRLVPVVLGLAVIAVAIWLWTVLFPSPERAIRSRLNALAKAISFDSKGGLLTQAYNAQKVGEFFTTDVDVEVDVSGYGPMSFHGRDEVLQAAAGARTQLSSLKVEFPDMNITLDPDSQGAKVNLTGKATVPGERDVTAQEFNFLMKKVNGKWMIYKVETVKTLATLTVARILSAKLRSG